MVMAGRAALRWSVVEPRRRGQVPVGVARARWVWGLHQQQQAIARLWIAVEVRAEPPHELAHTCTHTHTHTHTHEPTC